MTRAQQQLGKLECLGTKVSALPWRQRVSAPNVFLFQFSVFKKTPHICVCDPCVAGAFDALCDLAVVFE